MSLLTDGKLASTVANALAGIVYPITLRRSGGDVYDPISGGVVPGTPVDHTARGFLSSFSTLEFQAGLVEAGDIKITLLAAGLAVEPSPAADTILHDGRTFTIISVKSDPARATWTIQAR